jgi:N6-L-threonylcarbamoyladenine synthase
MKILAIDTSCDDTSAAVINDDAVLSNVISSQVDLHRKWGGVVPDIARRAHTENIEPAIAEALKRAHVSVDDIDAYAATYGPGLALALEVGLKKAQELATTHSKPFVPIDHMEGHLLSSFARNAKGKFGKAPTTRDFPLVGLLVSGGHTELVYARNIGEYTVIGETLDDAAGEAFDKLAKMLDLGYPGGPIISEFAKKGKRGRFKLPVPMEKSNDLNFSFSGLKTACLYKIRDLNQQYRSPRSWVYDFCADFVESVIQSLVIKLDSCVTHYRVNGVLLGGGVISNVELRKRIRSTMRKRKLPVFTAYSPALYTDNAAMIGIAGYYAFVRKSPSIATGSAVLSVDRNPIASISQLPIIQGS